MRLASTQFLALTITSACAQAALAGPPFLTDDPAPTDNQHYEVYGFANGTAGKDGTGGAFGRTIRCASFSSAKTMRH